VGPQRHARDAGHRIGIGLWFGLWFWLGIRLLQRQRVRLRQRQIQRLVHVELWKLVRIWQFVWFLERQRERKWLGPARFRLGLRQRPAVRSSFIEGGMEGVPPAKWQQSGLSSEEEVKA